MRQTLHVRIYGKNGRGHKDLCVYLLTDEAAALLQALQSWEKDEAAGLNEPDGWNTEIVDGEWRLMIDVDSDANFVKPS